MKYGILSLLALSTALVSGCSITEDLNKYVTTKTFNKGVQVTENGEPVAPGEDKVVKAEVQPTTTEAPTVIVEKPITYTSHKLNATYPAGIDVVARAIKREFRFNSPKDLRRKYGDGADVEMATSYWRWVADVGHYYQMRNYVRFESSKNVVDIEVFPADKGTKVITTYWVESGNSVQSRQVKDAIREKINNAVLPYISD